MDIMMLYVLGYRDDESSAKAAKDRLDKNKKFYNWFWSLPMPMIDSVLELIDKYDTQEQASRAGEE